MHSRLTLEKNFISLAMEEAENKKSIEKAAKDGNLASVKEFLETGGNVNSDFDSLSKYTLLHYASSCGHKHIVEYLLTCSDINPMIVDGNGAMPLHLATLNSHPEIVQILCEGTQNKNINSKTRHGNTPLHMAVDGTNDLVIIARSNSVLNYLLLIPGIEVITHNCEDETPLSLAKNYQRFDLLIKLIKAATIYSRLSIRSIPPSYNCSKLSISFVSGIHIKDDDQFKQEVILPNMMAAFDNNPESEYKVATLPLKYTYGPSYIGQLECYLIRKDNTPLPIWIDNSDIEKIVIQLAKNTDIKIKNFCDENKFDIYPYKACRDKSAFQAFLVPVLISFVRQIDVLPIDIWLKIFSYCNDVINDVDKVKKGFNTALQTIINNDDGKSLVSFYSSAGGSMVRVSQLSIFSRTASEKVDKLKEWAKENQGGAAEKTLTNYLLK